MAATRPRIGGIEHATEIIDPLSPLLRIPELKRVLTAEQEVATAQRLGFVMEAGGAQRLAQVTHNWLPARLVLVPLSRLDGDRKIIPVVDRWQGLNNSSELNP